MAPSAVETTTNPVTESPKVKLYSGHVEGAYKELSPTSYIRESEEKGIDGHAAAKVSYLYLLT
jgi:sulfonate dioxygenase